MKKEEIIVLHDGGSGTPECAIPRAFFFFF
jgi:hypothetical protein